MGKSLTYKDACNACKLKNQCSSVGGCGLLSLYLNQADDTLSSRYEDTKHNIWMGDFHEIPISNFGEESSDNYLEKIDRTELKAFFDDIDYEILPIGVQMFYDYFFLGFSVKDLTVKFDCTEGAVRAGISQVAQNLKDAIKYITKKKIYIRKRKELSLPKNIQYFLAYYVDDLTTEEIALAFGEACSSIGSSLKKTKGLIERGQIVLKLEDTDLVMKRLRRPGSTKPRPEEEYLRKPFVAP